jgi:hypothetical protein
MKSDATGALNSSVRQKAIAADDMNEWWDALLGPASAAERRAWKILPMTRSHLLRKAEA